MVQGCVQGALMSYLDLKATCMKKEMCLKHAYTVNVSSVGMS